MQTGIKAFCQKHITIVLSVCIFLLAVIIYSCSLVDSSDAAYVTAILDGDLYGTYSLAGDYTIRIESADGYNILVIRDGVAYISEADCANQVCVHTKGISTAGRQIVCLPHKLVISVDTEAYSERILQDGDRERGIDAVTN